MIRKFLPALIILLCVSGIATARNCRQFFYAAPVQQTYVAPYVQPQVYYGVGADLQTEALAEKVAALVEKKLALRAAIRQQQTAEPLPNSALAQNCAKCHSGDSPKAGLVYDGVHELSCSSITKALRAIASGKMPKGKVIDSQTKGDLMSELLDSEHQEGPLPSAPKPAPVPPAPSPDLE